MAAESSNLKPQWLSRFVAERRELLDRVKLSMRLNGIETMEAESGFQLPGEARTWCQWANGAVKTFGGTKSASVRKFERSATTLSYGLLPRVVIIGPVECCYPQLGQTGCSL